MPPAITASPHRATPSRAYCTAPTSRSPRPFPFLGCGCARRKNCSLTVGFTAYNDVTDCERFGLGGKIRSNGRRGGPEAGGRRSTVTASAVYHRESVRLRHQQRETRNTRGTYAETMCEDRRSRRSYRNICGTCRGFRLQKVSRRETLRACVSLTSPCGPCGMRASERGVVPSKHSTRSTPKSHRCARPLLTGARVWLEQLFQQLLEEAKQRGDTRVSLETGAMDFFLPACALYASCEF